MMALFLSTMRARRGLAAITMLLTAMGAAAAAGGPLFQAAAAESLRGVEVNAASAPERALVGISADSPDESGPDAPELPYVPGFTTIGGAMAEVVSLDEARPLPMVAVWRSGACEHLVVVRGRCATSDREVVLPADGGPGAQARPGDDIAVALRSVDDPRPQGPAQHLTVVGLYARPAVSDPYWVGRPELLGLEAAAAFTTERTVAAISRDRVTTVDLVASPGAFADLDRLRVDLKNADTQLTAGGYVTNADLLQALTRRISAGEEQLATSLLMAVVPLVLICWLVLFIAVGGGVEHRRGELALTALRGVPGRLRWFLATAETAVPVLFALVPGYLLGYGATALLARFVLPGSPQVEPNAASIMYAALAVLGALTAGVLAQLRALTTPVLGLLRKARVRRGGALVGSLEVAVGGLALLAGYQAAVGGPGSGIGLLAPLCVSLGLGLIVARGVSIPAERYGRRALRQGRLRAGLAALSLARDGGTYRIVVLLTIVFGMLGFALTAHDVAERAWQDRSVVEGGAVRVLTVQTVPAAVLLDAVRTADPQGRYAMAVAGVSVAEHAKVLAVDSPRLSSTALWPATYGPTPATEVGRLLRPVPVSPATLQAHQLQVTVTLDEVTAGAHARLTLAMTGPTGMPVMTSVDRLRPGTHAYRLDTPSCADAPCMLNQVEVTLVTPDAYRIDLTIGPIRDGNGRPQITAAQLVAENWRLPVATAARPVPALELGEGGIRLHVDSVLAPDIRLLADSAPVALPVVGAGELPRELSSNWGSARVPVNRVGTLAQVPRYGASGLLVDLEYLDMRLSLGSVPSEMAVWLAADAPADIVSKLRMSGLVVTGEHAVAAQRRLYGDQAPALAVSFLAAAAYLGVLFAAGGLLVMAALERGRDLTRVAALRAQGLPARIVYGAALGSRWALVVVGGVAGLLAAGGSWLLAHGVVPIFSDGASVVPTSYLPDPAQVLVPAAIAILALLLVCVPATRLAAGSSEGVDQ